MRRNLMKISKQVPSVVMLSLLALLSISCSKKSDVGNSNPGKFPIAELTSDSLENWFTKSPEQNGVEGVQADRAMTELKLEHPKEIIVAVIDSGVDIEHEDLKGKNENESKIWINKKEIPNNGKDDDENGFTDDVHGWNFLGGYDKDGKAIHIDAEQLEVTRELVKIKAKKKALQKKGKDLTLVDQRYLEKLQAEVDEGIKSGNEALKTVNERLEILKTNYEVLKDVLELKFEEVTEGNIKALSVANKEQEEAKAEILKVFDLSASKTVDRYYVLKKRYEEQTQYYYNEDFQPRKKIVGDNPDNFKDTSYGNNDVKGPDARHGTHVSGIIAAIRNNDVGINGIAQNVKIMALRAVPNGDERDKDVALAIRYAADNGANIINMSFGKEYSPHRHLVSEALLYAQSKNVLIMHASGNDSTDRDMSSKFPEKKIFNKKGEIAGNVENFMDIGASSASLTRELVATFTNFGQTTVDIFAPGVMVTSTTPDNKYASFNGTSMACPSAAGVAALVWSQMPDATAQEIKQLMMKNARSRAGTLVRLPSDHKKDVLFETLSITGGIADAYLMLTK